MVISSTGLLINQLKMINGSLVEVIKLVNLVNWKADLFAPGLGLVEGASLNQSLGSHKPVFAVVISIDVKKEKVAEY